MPGWGWRRIADRLRYALVWLGDRPRLRQAAFLVWWLALVPIDVGVRLIVRRGAKGDRRRLLVVRTDGIGDLVIFLDALTHLRRIYPWSDWEITCLVRHAAASIALGTRVFDHVIGIDIPGLVLNVGYRWAVLGDARRRAFDAVLYPVYSRDFLWGDSIVAVTGAQERISAAEGSRLMGSLQRWISNRWYTRLLEWPDDTRMVLRWNAAFMRSLGAEARAQLPVLADSGVVTTAAAGAYFVVFPGAHFDYRRWPTERFSELARRIHTHTGWSIVLCGGPTEQQLTARVARSLDGLPVTDLAGETTMEQLVSLVRNARFLIANDTSTAHIGAATGVPTAVVVGGGEPGKFFPYLTDDSDAPVGPLVLQHPLPCFCCNWQCVYRVPPGEPKPCITSVGVDEAWDSVRNALAPEPNVR